jgi:DNA (cytosine-5)-methyltransferase 1
MLDPVTLCGDSLRLGVRRHRLFESNLSLVGTTCWHDRAAPAVAVYGSYGQRRTGQNGGPSAQDGRDAMGIDWMPWPALTQAIPPAFTHWLGVQLLNHLRHHQAAGQTSPPALLSDVCDLDVTQRPRTSPGQTSPLALVEGHASPHDPGASVTPAGLRHCRCGNPLPPRPATGRWPRYCSQACRQAAYRTRTNHKEAAA